ncbi:MAG: flagellar motor switch protein FliN [Gammaproteobacteria bacterium]
MNAATEEPQNAEDDASTPDTESAVEPTEAASDAPETPKAEFADLGAEGQVGAGIDGDEVELDVILDVPVTLSLEVGRTSISIRDLLRLNQGSVVELNRPADQPMDVRANGTLIARAEIVVVDDMFGIRLIDVVSPSERIRKIN